MLNRETYRTGMEMTGKDRNFRQLILSFINVGEGPRWGRKGGHSEKYAQRDCATALVPLSPRPPPPWDPEISSANQRHPAAVAKCYAALPCVSVTHHLELMTHCRASLY